MDTQDSLNTTKPDEPPRGVAAVDRAFSIIAAIQAGDAPRNLSEISRATGLYKSTVLRLLESLQAAGYVARIDALKYTLGPTIMQLGMAYERVNPLRHQIQPMLENLVGMGCESPSFHVRQSSDERLCLFRQNSNHSTLDRVRAGDRLPLARGAAGKVLMAFDTPGADGKEMNKIRRDCFAVSLGERDKFCAGVAAPVFSGQAHILGALSFSGPRERFTKKDVAGMKATIRDAARALSQEFGSDYPV